MNKTKMNMCEGPLFKNVVLYTLPIILTGILQLLFNAADLIIVGRFRGSDSVAAVGATTAIINLIFIVIYSTYRRSPLRYSPSG